MLRQTSRILHVPPLMIMHGNECLLKYLLLVTLFALDFVPFHRCAFVWFMLKIALLTLKNQYIDIFTPCLTHQQVSTAIRRIYNLRRYSGKTDSRGYSVKPIQGALVLEPSQVLVLKPIEGSTVLTPKQEDIVLVFHHNHDLVLISSGDVTAHIWQAAVNWEASNTGNR
uniref:Uncharacterized protein n=1 Tax=Glossina brevipalpis TaxID=37001 RepID=A0A1A9WN73_9MUSC